MTTTSKELNLKKTLAILGFTLSLCGCGLPQKGLWKYQSGAEALTTEKPDDSAIIRTDFGRIKIQPYFVNSAYGFVVKVWIENDSNKAVAYKSTDFKIQAASGESYDALDEEAVKTSVDANVGQLNGMMGAGYGTQAGVSADVWKQTKAQMLKSGEVPSKATKTGLIYFNQEASKGLVKVRITNLVQEEKIIEFTTKK